MNKEELTKKVSVAADITKKNAEAAINAAVEEISKAIASGDDVKLSGFGIFSTKVRAERTCRNPKTGEVISVPSTTVPVFHPASALKNACNAK